MHTDQHGHAVTANGSEAVSHYDATVTAYLGFSPETGRHLKAMLTSDPEMPLAHALKGYFFLLFSKRALVAKANAARDAAKAARDARGANDREALHLAALDAWLADDLATAVDRWEDVLRDHPRDPIALRLAHYMHFYMGNGAAMRDSVERVLGSWSKKMPDYGYVLGVAAFAHEEAGDYKQAEAYGRQAVEINHADIWGLHAVAHVMEMQGRQQQGIDWITAHEADWTRANNFRFHVWWHRALFHLELKQSDAALELYDAHIRGEEPDSDDYLDMSNAIALLWRLQACGINVGDRWQELAAKSAERIDDRMLMFADAHFMMALAEADHAKAPELLDKLAAYAADATDAVTESGVTAAVGVPLACAIDAYAREDYRVAADLLAPVVEKVRLIGGSHAQRDLFVQLLIHAELKGGLAENALKRLEARTEARPSVASGWNWLAEARAQLGDRSGASDALTRAKTLVAA